MTLGELKKAVGFGKRPGENPGLRKVRAQEVFVKKELDGAVISVLKNGWVLYESGSSSFTVFTLADCGDYTYDTPEGRMTIPEEEFDGMDWPVRLTLEGEDRAAHNAERREKRSRAELKPPVFENGSTGSREMLLESILDPTKPLMEEEITDRLLAQEILASLSPQQRELLQLVADRKETGMSMAQIAEKLHISTATVYRRTEKLRENIRRAVEENRKLG